MISRDGYSFTKAQYIVLPNSTFVAPYLEEHKNIVHFTNPAKNDSWIKVKHTETFGSWLQTHLINDSTVEEQLYVLAGSPSSTIGSFQGYEIHGNTFYTIAQDKKSTNQNSGVRFDATNENGKRTDTMVT